ncbi:MAG: hypothetical protein ACK5N8_06190 [Alphaproteobacteria bacterium]
MSSENGKIIKKIKIKKPINSPLTPESESIIDFDSLDNGEDISFESIFGNTTHQDWEEKTKISENYEKEKQNKIEEKEEQDDFDQLLYDFITNDCEPTEDLKDIKESLAQIERDEQIKKKSDDEVQKNLLEEEKALFDAYRNFVASIDEIAQDAKLSKPKFSIRASVLYPKFKPSIGRKIAKDTLIGWDLMMKAHPSRISSIEPTATDEELLDFAERTTDENLQMAIISYVEILIEIESCEISYEKRKVTYQRKTIEKEIYMEHKRREERAQKYIAQIRKKEFPIDADRLVRNFFKTSKKDADGAFHALTTSPATFAPIDFNKIKPRLFGLLKVTPQDGVKINKKIGEFLRYLRV